MCLIRRSWYALVPRNGRSGCLGCSRFSRGTEAYGSASDWGRGGATEGDDVRCIASHVVHVSVPSPTHEAREADGHDRCTSTLSGRHITVREAGTHPPRVSDVTRGGAGTTCTGDLSADAGEALEARKRRCTGWQSIRPISSGCASSRRKGRPHKAHGGSPITHVTPHLDARLARLAQLERQRKVA